MSTWRESCGLRYRPEHDVKLLTHGPSLVAFFLITQNDGVEVREGPGILHDFVF